MARGLSARAQLYDPADRAKLRVESGGLFEDVPRMADGNRDHRRPSQRREHDHRRPAVRVPAVPQQRRRPTARRRATTSSELYTQARRLTTWHYQWMILHEFLPLFVGRSLVDDDAHAGPALLPPPAGEAYIPVEFQGAAYRFGHSMVRPSYRANLAGDEGKPFFGLVFDPSRRPGPTPTTSAEASARRGASSAGRPSSISATGR